MPNTNAWKQVLTRKRSRKPPSLLHFHLLLFVASVPLLCWILEYFALSDVFIAFQNCHEIKDTDVTHPTSWEILFQYFIEFFEYKYKCVYSLLCELPRIRHTSTKPLCRPFVNPPRRTPSCLWSFTSLINKINGAQGLKYSTFPPLFWHDGVLLSKNTVLMLTWFRRTHS